jgi:hypothetical protein
MQVGKRFYALQDITPFSFLTVLMCTIDYVVVILFATVSSTLTPQCYHLLAQGMAKAACLRPWARA